MVPGRAAHAATRLEGRSAIDRYVAVHAALAEHERAVNARVEHPLMRELALPYPLLVGRVAAGAWSSQVPDRLEFEGRLGVPVGGDVADARAALEAVVAAALDDGEAPAEIAWPAAVRARRDRARPPLGGRPWRPRSPTSSAARCARRACRGAPTCATSPRAGSRARWPARPGSSSRTPSTSALPLADLTALARSLVRVLARARRLI